MKLSDCISTIFQGLSYLEIHRHRHLNEIIENNLERLGEIKNIIDEKPVKTLIEYVENLAIDRTGKGK